MPPFPVPDRLRTLCSCGMLIHEGPLSSEGRHSTGLCDGCAKEWSRQNVQEPLPRPETLEQLMGGSGKGDLEMAAWFKETPETYARNTAEGLRAGYSENYGSCPWPTWRIKEALLARMKEAK